MPDITMCVNYSCKSKDKCYRVLAQPTPKWQAYSYFGGENCKNCDHFYKLKTRKEMLNESDDKDELLFIEALLKGEPK